MEKVQRLVNWRLVAIVTITLMVSIYFTMASGVKLFVNGNEVPTSQGQPFDKDGKTYIPLEVVIKGMGDKYTWNHSYRTATIQKSNGQKIQVTNGKSVSKVGYKFVPLATKKVKNTTVATGHRALMINDVVYVPIDFIQSVMGYPITIKNEGGGTIIYVGKVPQPTASTPTPKPSEPTPKPTQPTPTPAPTPKPSEPAPTPTPTPTPQPTPTPAPSSLNREAVINSLVSNYNYLKAGNTGATFNPWEHSDGSMYSVAIDLNNPNSLRITIKGWTGSSPETATVAPSVRHALNLIIPSGSSNIFAIVDATAKTGSHSGLNKTYSYDGYNVKVIFSGSYVLVTFNK